MTLSTRAWLLMPSIVRIVVPAGRPGVYLLGGVAGPPSVFVPHYVGRSDLDVRQRLAYHEKLPLATHFCVRLCMCAEEAFLRECFYWHALQDEALLMNNIHPDSPNRARLQCPYCTTSNYFSRYFLRGKV